MLVALNLSAPSANAARITSAKVSETAQMPHARPDWPVPSEPGQLFYIQRSTNSNTVVYVARFDASGNLRADDPIQVYWRRYNTTGVRKALKFIEKQFLFGLNIKPGTYDISLKPLPQIAIQLVQTGPGRAELRTRIAGKLARPVYCFTNVDETGLLPRVTHFTIYGYDLATGRALSETYRVRGGEIGQ